MADSSLKGSTGRKRQWFARRQIYLRTGQDSQYVELSPLLQVSVALGFAALALWLIGASYGAASNFFGEDKRVALLAQLNDTERVLGKVERERDAALNDATRLADLEAELAEAKTTIAEANGAADKAPALRAELEQTGKHLEDLRLRLSETEADKAALQARFEAEILATSDQSEKTAEEAVSLQAQLENAYEEIASLGQERDEATAKLAALNEENSAKDEAAERNTALLKAATAEIERFQEAIALAGSEADEAASEYQAKITKLEEQIGEITLDRHGLQDEVSDLSAKLEEARTASLETSEVDRSLDADAKTSADVAVHAQLIAAGLAEADLLATIDGLRAELASTTTDNAESAARRHDDEVAALRQRVTLAESEVERLVLSGLKADVEPAPAPTPANTVADATSDERLRSELLTARADIIKPNADVKAAKQRLADKAAADNGETARPDNSAKLAQQLASTRSKVQQLNKALADAKLREVAIDLALISVVPSPSPPAPR